MRVQLPHKNPKWNKREQDRRIASGVITFVSEGSGYEGDWDVFDHNSVNALKIITGQVRLS